MSRATTFIILTIIMLTLAAMAAFKLNQEFDLVKKIKNYMTTYEKQKNIAPNALEKNPFVPPSAQVIERISSNNQLPQIPGNASAEDYKDGTSQSYASEAKPIKNYTPDSQHAPVDAPSSDTPKDSPQPTDEIFVWVTEAPTALKPNEKPITQTRLAIEEKEMSFQLVTQEPVKARSMVLQNPDRIVIDIPGNWVASMPPIPSENPWLKKIRTGYSKGQTRLVLELKKTPASVENSQPKNNVIDLQVQ